LATLEKRTDSKKGPRFGRFGRKTGGWARKKAFYFALFHVFVVFFFCMLLSDSLLQIPAGSKKNRA
jgi:hypothetical protein